MVEIHSTGYHEFVIANGKLLGVNRCARNPKMYLRINNNSPLLHENVVGKDIITNPRRIVEWLGKYLFRLRTMWLEDNFSDGNDNWFIGLAERGGL